LNVLRDFADSEIVKEGSVDPETDYQVIETELILKDLETVTKVLESKDVKAKGMEKKRAVVEKLMAGLNNGKSARDILKTDEEKELARDLFLLTAKKEIRVYNVSESDPRLREPMGENLFICAKVESELSSLGEMDARAYMAELGIKESGLDLLIKKAYIELGLISFLTTGEMESRAWTTTKGEKAPQAAAVIHTDFEKKFIKTKVCDYAKFVEAGGWKEAADKGWVRFEGKEYEMKDGDVVEFMIGS
jgi:ribosome-binding ATPase